MCRSLTSCNDFADSKLQISELIEALPVERNFLQQFLGTEITHMDVDIIFDHYDKDGSGQIQHEEVASLVRDIYCQYFVWKSDNLAVNKLSFQSLHVVLNQFLWRFFLRFQNGSNPALCVLRSIAWNSSKTV